MMGFGFLVNIDRCTGCMACEAACKVVNKLPAGTSWLNVIRNRPEEVDDKLVMDFYPAPRSLEKCRECLTKEGGVPLCAKVCMGQAIVVDKLDKLVDISRKRRSLLFTA